MSFVVPDHITRALPLFTRRVGGLLALALLCSCAAGEPEVRGDIERLVGETITVELVEGDPTLAGQAELVDASGKRFDSKAINTHATSNKQLEFVIPAGVAAGPATLHLARQDQEGDYRVSITIDRVAAAMAGDEIVHFIPLPPSVLSPFSVTLGAAPSALSWLPSARYLATLSGDQVSFIRPSKQPEIDTSVRVPGASSIAALPDGALVGTPSAIVLVRLEQNGIAAHKGQLAVTHTKALAVTPTGDKAVALTECDTDDDLTVDADCLVPIDLSPDTPRFDAPVPINASPSATAVAIDPTGVHAVTADRDAIIGVDFSVDPPNNVTKLAWPDPPGEPVAVERTQTVINGNIEDIFSVAEGRNMMISSAAFADHQIQRLQQVPLQMTTAPEHMAFGRGTDLYITSGTSAFKVDVSHASLSGIPLDIAVPNNTVSFDVPR